MVPSDVAMSLTVVTPRNILTRVMSVSLIKIPKTLTRKITKVMVSRVKRLSWILKKFPKVVRKRRNPRVK